MRKFFLVCAATAKLYLDKRVSRAAAALSYFLMLSVFPLLVCLYVMLGNMFPTAEAISSFVKGVLPDELVNTIVDYLGYVTQNAGNTLIAMSLAAMATASAAAYRTLDNVMGELWGSKRFSGPFAFAFSFVFSLIFLAAMYFSVIIIISGQWFIRFADEHIHFLNISASWQWGRFLVLFLLILFINMGLYRLTAPRRRSVHIYTGAIAASAALVAVSVLFSYFIGISAKYPLVYGSLASVMIMLLWLYICGNIVIIGNIVNVVLDRI